MKYTDKNTDSLTNLSLLDPPRWGWSANGGITDLLTPHERARRQIGKREYLHRQQTKKSEEEKRKHLLKLGIAANSNSNANNSKNNNNNNNNNNSNSSKAKKSTTHATTDAKAVAGAVVAAATPTATTTTTDTTSTAKVDKTASTPVATASAVATAAAIAAATTDTTFTTDHEKAKAKAAAAAYIMTQTTTARVPVCLAVSSTSRGIMSKEGNKDDGEENANANANTNTNASTITNAKDNTSSARTTKDDRKRDQTSSQEEDVEMKMEVRVGTNLTAKEGTNDEKLEGMEVETTDSDKKKENDTTASTSMDMEVDLVNVNVETKVVDSSKASSSLSAGPYSDLIREEHGRKADSDSVSRKGSDAKGESQSKGGKSDHTHTNTNADGRNTTASEQQQQQQQSASQTQTHQPLHTQVTTQSQQAQNTIAKEVVQKKKADKPKAQEPAAAAAATSLPSPLPQLRTQSQLENSQQIYHHPKYDFFSYKVDAKSKGRAKRERFDLEVVSMISNGTSSNALKKNEEGGSTSISDDGNGEKKNSAAVSQDASKSTSTSTCTGVVSTTMGYDTNSKVLHPDAYHRGIAGEEPRSIFKGYLLCDVEQTDTNHDWDIHDENALQLAVLIEFPLVNIDDKDDEGHQSDCGVDDDEDIDMNDGDKPRRKTRRGGENGTNDPNEERMSETERRQKREAAIKALPHFRDVVNWDLSNPKTPSPMVYATDCAAEFGLSFCQTLDLARSIQKQIDEFVRDSGCVDYHVPVTTKDPFGMPRDKGVLHPPKYTTPKILHGGHCAKDVTTTAKPFEKRKVTRVVHVHRGPDRKVTSSKSAAPNTDTNSAPNGVNGKKVGGPSPKASCVKQFAAYEIAPPDQLPKNDLNSFGVHPMYAQEFFRRALEENKKAIKKIDDGIVGKASIKLNHYCHFCHMKRPIAIQYPCGNESHTYCDLHTCRRMGYSVEQAVANKIDYCPICTFVCTCYRCSGRSADLVRSYAKECQDQNKGLDELHLVQYNFVWNCSRNLAQKLKRATEAAENVNTQKSTRRKNNQMTRTSSPTEGKTKKVLVPKVPRSEFPGEMSSGFNRDPSLKDDYNTIFTPEGSRLCPLAVEKAAKEAEKDKAKPKVIVEDGNVEICDVCNKTGDLICCDKCPRGFHAECLKIDTTTLPPNWVCHRCQDDCSQRDGDVMAGVETLEEISTAYQSLAESPDFSSKIKLLSKIYDMTKFLVKYDFGYIFAEPVDCKQVRNYRTFVKRPMDLGTIQANILKGLYLKSTSPKRTKDLPGIENATDMDVVIVAALKDIEQIWHNCFLFNREGSSFYRMGQVLRAKSSVIRRASFEDELNVFIRQNLGIFVDECKMKRQELTHSLKPWIPTSKYSINVPFRGGSGRKVIAVFDKETNMVIKQYSSMAATCLVVEFLSNLGHKTETKVTNKQTLKQYINSMAEDPSLSLFGYRWLCIDDLRAGNFKIGTNPAVVKKQCMVSKAILKEFVTIEDAFNDWQNTKKVCVSVPQEDETESTLDFFKKTVLDGGAVLDQQRWIRVQKTTDNPDTPSEEVKKDEIKSENKSQKPDSLDANSNATNSEKSGQHDPSSKLETNDVKDSVGTDLNKNSQMQALEVSQSISSPIAHQSSNISMKRSVVPPASSVVHGFDHYAESTEMSTTGSVSKGPLLVHEANVKSDAHDIPKSSLPLEASRTIDDKISPAVDDEKSKYQDEVSKQIIKDAMQETFKIEEANEKRPIGTTRSGVPKETPREENVNKDQVKSDSTSKHLQDAAAIMSDFRSKASPDSSLNTNGEKSSEAVIDSEVRMGKMVRTESSTSKRPRVEDNCLRDVKKAKRETDNI